jgi:ferric-dicitrate binding protein FerR (iron transport regulator)
MLTIASSDLCRRDLLMHWTDELGDMVSFEERAQLREEAVAWVIRFHRGGMPPENQRAFDVWHAQSPAHAHMFQKVFTVWDSAELRAAAAVVVKRGSSSFNVKTALHR